MLDMDLLGAVSQEKLKRSWWIRLCLWFKPRYTAIVDMDWGLVLITFKILRKTHYVDSLQVIEIRDALPVIEPASKTTH